METGDGTSHSEPHRVKPGSQIPPHLGSSRRHCLSGEAAWKRVPPGKCVFSIPNPACLCMNLSLSRVPQGLQLLSGAGFGPSCDDVVPFLALMGVSLPLSHASFGELRCFMLFTHGLCTRYLHSEGESGCPAGMWLSHILLPLRSWGSQPKNLPQPS